MDQTSKARQSPKDMVRSGYDEVSYRYRDDDGNSKTGYAVWLGELWPLLSPGARVLDLGCGCGVPGTKLLANDNKVTGVDISPVQIQRARQLVPEAEFHVADMSELDFDPGSFDAIVSFFAIIHLPVGEQPDLFRKIHDWLVPDGWLMASVGHRAWTGTEDDWYGAGMYWSHEDEGTYRSWLEDLGFEIRNATFIPEGESGHTLFLARKQ